MPFEDIDTDSITMPLLFRHAGQPTKFRILSVLSNQKATPTQLSNRLSLNRSNITSQLSELRELGFVDYQKLGRRHRYSVREPLPTQRHELVIDLIDLEPGDPEKDPLKKTEREHSNEKIRRKIRQKKTERFHNKLKLWASFLDHPGLTSPGYTQKKLQDKIEEIDREIRKLQLSD